MVNRLDKLLHEFDWFRWSVLVKKECLPQVVMFIRSNKHCSGRNEVR